MRASGPRLSAKSCQGWCLPSMHRGCCQIWSRPVLLGEQPDDGFWCFAEDSLMMVLSISLRTTKAGPVCASYSRFSM